AISDKHRQLSVLKPGQVDEFDGILPSHGDERLVAEAEQRIDELTDTDLEETAVEFGHRFHRSIQLGAPTPRMGIEFGEIIVVQIHPAQVQRRMKADGDAESMAMPYAEVESREPPHGSARQHMRFPLRPDRVVRAHEFPDVLKDPVLEITEVAI